MQESTVARIGQALTKPGDDPTDKPIRRRIRQALSCQRQVLLYTRSLAGAPFQLTMLLSIGVANIDPNAHDHGPLVTNALPPM